MLVLGEDKEFCAEFKFRGAWSQGVITSGCVEPREGLELEGLGFQNSRR